MQHTAATAKRIFKAWSSSFNPLTPDVIRYGWKDGRPYELTEGTSIFDPNQDTYGVTVLEPQPERPNGWGSDHDASCLFYSLNDAQAYIESGFAADLRTGSRRAKDT